MKKENWDKLPELEKFFDSIKLDEYDEILLQTGQKIHNLKHFVTGHLQMCKTHNGNKTFLPYYERLLLLKEILERKIKL